ncbi:adenosylcobinamide-GDP ribazoletransferase [Ruegeria sp. SCPT10]|uniref:adenosylcobinamide-GDP ribazoletransferase n=1 Tax=Ruegeria sp. SCP10 TaxID=3141377 RepID=UPI00333A7AE1
MHKNDTNPVSAWDIPLALVLLTRLPLPRLPDHVFARQARAVWAFPVVGVVVGGLACAVGWVLLALSVSPFVSAVLVVGALIIATGAMHEDGLADTFDGLWGGFTAERRLEIMKDSHIGTYGVLALISTQLIRISAIATLLSAGAFWAILATCVLSRAMMPLLMAALPNARQSGLSHSVGTPNAMTVTLSLGLAIVIGLLLAGTQFLLPAICAAVIVFGLCLLAKKKIGGQTGDILGASQQLAEITFLVAISAQL